MHQLRPFAQREADNRRHRAKAMAQDWYAKRRRGELSREDIKTRLEKLPEDMRELTRMCLNELHNNYVTRQI